MTTRTLGGPLAADVDRAVTAVHYWVSLGYSRPAALAIVRGAFPAAVWVYVLAILDAE